MKKSCFLILTALAASFWSCSKPANSPAQNSATHDTRRIFEVRGIVRGPATSDNSVLIEHEDIPGLMPSMTMPFAFKDRREAAGVKVGDAIAFQLVADENDWRIQHVKRIDAASVHLPQSGSLPAAEPVVERLREGDAMPAFKLVDQNGRELTRESVAGKTVVLTFIFTRCPVPNFCPRMTANFSSLQRDIAADAALNGHVQLVSISFDPEHDTPETLAQYGSAFTKDLDSWRFATGSPDEIKKLTGAFSIYVKTEGGTISHTLCTAMISPGGTIQKIWRGNGWETAEILDTLRNPTAAK